MARRNTENEAVADEQAVEPATPVLPPSIGDVHAVDEQPTDEAPVDELLVADAGPDREPDPTPAPERSELVLAAIRRGVPSYKAWAMSDADLTGRQEA
jgi:hypothetical protein